MGCWNDFGSLVGKYIPDYSDTELATATLQAALQLGDDLNGFTDSYTTHEYATEGSAGGACGCGTLSTATVGLPILPGWELTVVNSVTVNGVPIYRMPAGRRCMRYTVDCNTVSISPPPCGSNATITIGFGVKIVAGLIGSEMPNFLFEKFNTPMTFKIIALILTMRKDFKSASVYEVQYHRTKNQIKARTPAGTATIDARGALWI